MHVLHLLKVEAGSHEEAEKYAEETINNWVDKDTWSCICGSIREDGAVHSTERGFFDPVDYNLSTIKELSREWCKNSDVLEEKMYELAELLVSYKPICDRNIWRYALKYCLHQVELGDINWQTFDPWQQEFRSYQLKKNGVTKFIPLLCTNKLTVEPTDNVAQTGYLVFIDTHTLH